MKTTSTQTQGRLSITAKDIAELEAEAQKFAPRNKPWSEEEDAVVLRFYGRVPTSVLTKKLNRNFGSIQNRYSRIRSRN